MNRYIEIALKEAEKASKKGEVPIGAVIVKDGKIISKAHNNKEKTKVVTKHAEIIAIEKACKKLKTWHLNDCELYTTVEPCLMCTGAIIQSRIKKVIFSIENEKFGAFLDIIKEKNLNVKYEKEIEIEKATKLMQDFFENKRKWYNEYEVI